MSIKLVHPSGATKKAPTGFSWTTLFFGGFVMLFRRDFKHMLIHAIFMLCTFGLSSFIYPFIYNRIYLTNLLLIGCVPATPADEKKLRKYI